MNVFISDPASGFPDDFGFVLCQILVEYIYPDCFRKFIHEFGIVF
jgi:hypothetical protein